MNKGFATRLKEFRKSLGPKVTQTDLAERIGGGIELSNITSWERGHVPDGGNMNLLLKAFPNLNKDWLLEGEGEMLLDPTIKTANTKDESPTLTSRLVALLENIVKNNDTLAASTHKLAESNYILAENNKTSVEQSSEVMRLLIEKLRTI